MYSNDTKLALNERTKMFNHKTLTKVHFLYANFVCFQLLPVLNWNNKCPVASVTKEVAGIFLKNILNSHLWTANLRSSDVVLKRLSIQGFRNNFLLLHKVS